MDYLGIDFRKKYSIETYNGCLILMDWGVTHRRLRVKNYLRCFFIEGKIDSKDL